MITNKELNAVKLSPTKKDFYQIWNELLDTAGKISERWDPVSTNESDPGIVLLKVLTAIADKLNYNIDANTLEAFMPSAAQEDSMRKLTEMLGYSMKYYQSATTEVKISYDKNVDSPIQGFLVIDKFTNIKDIDDSINYVTLTPLNLTKEIPFGTVTCMEGELVECETADNNIVSIFHLDDNHRYFLPETQIAENSIFITNIENNIEGTEWKQVSNLNAQSLGAKVFKFGFDSQEGLPYIQFPDDISTIIEDGLRIKYIRTRGNDGNIAVNTLTKLTVPASWSAINQADKQAYHDVANFSVTNIRAATNGTTKESINAAYNNFKKTIGTFDTLVTCRDYMNKIYQLVSSIDNTTPLVSNIIVSDIKSDINRAVTLGTFTSRGIEYKVIAKKDKNNKDRLTHFDLILYPFKSTYGLNSKSEFEKSFKYDNSNLAEIITDLEDTKALAHNFIEPESDDIACIKNYYRLSAKVNTVRKVGAIEQASILNNIYKKLFENFNMRKLDFGEEIPYDTLLQIMENADSRIKSISLDEPKLSTKFMTATNKELTLSDKTGQEAYNSLALNNVLAGRIPLFNYNTDFVPDYTEKAYSGNRLSDDGAIEGTKYADIYPTDTSNETLTIHKIETEVEIPVKALESGHTVKLTANEVVQFKAPNLKTTVTYPAYVNYYFHRNKENSGYVAAIPATFQTLGDFLKGGPNATTAVSKAALEYYVNNTNLKSKGLLQELAPSEVAREDAGSFAASFNNIIKTGLAIFALEGTTYRNMPTADDGWTYLGSHSNAIFYTFKFDQSGSSSTGVAAWSNWLIQLTKVKLDWKDSSYRLGEANLKTLPAGDTLKGFYKVNGGKLGGGGGYLVDEDGTAFKLVETPKDIAQDPFTYYHIPRIWEKTEDKDNKAGSEGYHTADGLGQNTTSFGLAANVEYALGDGEYLLVNWVQTKEGSSDEKEEHWETYSKGDIIKPNFALEDSADHFQSNHSYTKKNVKQQFDVLPDLAGMFTLGTNEQIEIREVIKTTLNESNTNLYWEIPDLVSTEGGYVEFPFNERPINPKTGAVVTITEDSVQGRNGDFIYSEYTLKEGEYLYYTDMNKSDIAFYGFGSTIRCGHKTPTIFKYVSDDLISTTEISENGINAAIPWRNYNLSAADSAITITENQFINLTAGDELVNVDIAGEVINNTYKDISGSASWKLADATALTTLPQLDLKDSQYKWQVRSKLNLAIGPNKPQTLLTRVVNEAAVRDKIKLVNATYNKSGKETLTNLITLAAENEDTPLTIKANKLIQSATTVTDVTTKKVDAEGNLEEIIADLKLKIFETNTVTNNFGQIINFGNYGDGSFTTINCEEQVKQNYGAKTDQLETSVNILIPADHFGLLMIYYQNLNPDVDDANLATRPRVSATNNVLTFFDDLRGVAGVELQLRPGINIIKIAESTTLKLTTAKYTDPSSLETVANNKIVLTFDTLKLVPTNKEKSINPKLEYQKITEASAYDQILKDISKVDAAKEFYYSMPIEQSLDLDLNPRDENDTLNNALTWFNYNNINNKFVIAEIDTERLTDDIVIAKSSRSNF